MGSAGLAMIEEDLGSPITQYFDLIVGAASRVATTIIGCQSDEQDA